VRSAIIAFLFATLLTLCPTELFSQSPEAEVRAVVNALFDAMRAADGQAAAVLFHPDAELHSISEQDGQPILRSDPAAPFIEAIGTARTQVWDERISDIEVRLDGRLATAWMRYSFFIDETFVHCGVNVFQLFRGTAGWQIIQITDTRRQDGCPGT
jgi:hypothetical protein